MLRRRFLRSLSLLAAVCPAFGLPTPAAAQDSPTVVYLVRHAERAENGTNDPPISEAGWARARLLANMLRDAGITQVHTTDYLRTRSTVEPLAERLGLSIRSYDPADLEGFAARLRGTPGRHLVVGHSNTTPPLVAALHGEAGEPIAELEYDRLYILTLTAAGASTVLVRFGSPYAG